jgi:hypothetical protein
MPVWSVVEAILSSCALPDQVRDNDLGKLISGDQSAGEPGLMRARARGLIDGRLSPIDDVVACPTHPKHRMALTFAARADGEHGR